MKKTLLSFFTATLLAGAAFGQCTPDPMYASEEFGLWPDSIPFITNEFATGGMDYSTVIDIKTLRDTIVDAPAPLTGEITVILDAFKIESLTGAPTGFNYAEGGDSFDSGSGAWENDYADPNDPNTVSAVQGCLAISAAASDVTNAAPTTPGFTDYPITVLVDARIAQTTPDVSAFIPNGTWLSALSAFGLGSLPINDYVLRVHAAADVSVYELLKSTGFDVAQSYPNPTSGMVNIAYTTPTNQQVEIRIFNMLGEAMASERMTSNNGVNTFEFDTNVLSSGLYIYTVSNGEKTITKKMTVK